MYNSSVIMQFYRTLLQWTTINDNWPDTVIMVPEACANQSCPIQKPIQRKNKSSLWKDGVHNLYKSSTHARLKHASIFAHLQYFVSVCAKQVIPKHSVTVSFLTRTKILENLIFLWHSKAYKRVVTSQNLEFVTMH